MKSVTFGKQSERNYCSLHQERMGIRPYSLIRVVGILTAVKSNETDLLAHILTQHC